MWNGTPAWAGCNWVAGNPKGRIEDLLMNVARFATTGDAITFLHRHTTQFERGWHALPGIGAQAVFFADNARKSVQIAVADGRAVVELHAGIVGIGPPVAWNTDVWLGHLKPVARSVLARER